MRQAIERPRCGQGKVRSDHSRPRGSKPNHHANIKKSTRLIPPRLQIAPARYTIRFRIRYDAATRPNPVVATPNSANNTMVLLLNFNSLDT